MRASKQGWAPRPNLSKTSLSCLDECRRRYALQYFSKHLEPRLRREAEFHGRLMGWSALAGQVVDDVITSDLRLMTGSTYTFANSYMAQARAITKEYVTLSKRWVELYQTHQPPDRDARRQPLARYFFGDPPEPADKEQFMTLVETSLANFYRSSLAAEIAKTPPEHRVVPQPNAVTPWFLLGEIPVYAKYDFILSAPERTIIFDWKTGQVSDRTENQAREQLTIYAAYAHFQLGIPLEQIELASVWLGAGPDVLDRFRPDPQFIAELQQRWHSRYVELKELTARVEAGEDPLALFPKTGFPNRCRWCNFRMCEGYIESQQLLRESFPDSREETHPEDSN